jgi:hypothetical protein
MAHAPRPCRSLIPSQIEISRWCTIASPDSFGKGTSKLKTRTVQPHSNERRSISPVFAPPKSAFRTAVPECHLLHRTTKSAKKDGAGLSGVCLGARRASFFTQAVGHRGPKTVAVSLLGIAAAHHEPITSCELWIEPAPPRLRRPIPGFSITFSAFPKGTTFQRLTLDFRARPLLRVTPVFP